MPVLAAGTMNTILDAWLGTGRAAGVPDSYDIELWTDDPRNDGAAQLDYPEYAAVAWDSDDWDAAAAGQKRTTGYVEFPAPSDEATEAARYWALRVSGDDDPCFSAPLDNPLDVSGAGDGPRVRPVVFFIDPA